MNKKKVLSILVRMAICLGTTFILFRLTTDQIPSLSAIKDHSTIFAMLLAGVSGFLMIPQAYATANPYQPKRLKKADAAVQKPQPVPEVQESVGNAEQPQVQEPKTTQQTPVQKPAQKPTQKPQFYDQDAEAEAEKKQQPKNEGLNFGSSMGELKPIRSNVHFSDIAGYQQTKESVSFLVSCLKNPAGLRDVGAKLPKGMLLSGPPGTGKTFMAKAIAGEAKVPFFAVDGSRFQDIYVGQGPRNVRALFETAKQVAPCVIFIDEIDAIGGARNGGDTNSERRNTLNALLVELDGLSGTAGILTIAATNTPDELDPALVRPGRFDRKVYMPLPDINEREAILNIHCRNKNISGDVDFKTMAEATSGFSGSALATMANEAALNAVARGSMIVEKMDFDKAYFQSMTEGEQKRAATEEERRLVAYHEIGHALVMKMIEGKPVPFVTNISSTNGIGGFTSHPEGNTGMPTKLDMEHRIMTSYGGRAAEEIYCGDGNFTVGASSDITNATRLIREYLGAYGMGELGMLNVKELMGRPDSDMVEEAKKVSADLYQKTLDFLTENKDLLVAVSEELVKKEVLTDKEIDQIIKKTRNA